MKYIAMIGSYRAFCLWAEDFTKKYPEAKWNYSLATIDIDRTKYFYASNPERLRGMLLHDVQIVGGVEDRAIAATKAMAINRIKYTKGRESNE